MKMNVRRIVGVVLGSALLCGTFANALATIDVEKDRSDSLYQMQDNLIDDSYNPYRQDDARNERAQEILKGADIFLPEELRPRELSYEKDYPAPDREEYEALIRA